MKKKLLKLIMSKLKNLIIVFFIICSIANNIYANSIPIHAINEHKVQIKQSNNCYLHENEENKLKKFFYLKKGLFINKWDHYLDVYNIFFEKYKNANSINLLEIGVFQGGSLELWKHYFGNKLKIVGVDIMPKLKILENKKNNIFIEIGDQSDPNFLNYLSKKHGPFDIIIDDGGHQMNEQIQSFQSLLKNVKEGGLYITEDLFSSYSDNPNWIGAGLKKQGTYVEFIKNIIDELNGFFYKNGITENTKLIKSMHFYPSLLIIERSNYPKLNYKNPKSIICGDYGIDHYISQRLQVNK